MGSIFFLEIFLEYNTPKILAKEILTIFLPSCGGSGVPWANVLPYCAVTSNALQLVTSSLARLLQVTSYKAFLLTSLLSDEVFQALLFLLSNSLTLRVLLERSLGIHPGNLIAII